MRIAGLASGMDIDSIVKNLMTAERMPLDKLKQKKQIIEWKRDDYRSLNTQLLSFRDKLSQLKLTPNYRARTVSSSNEGRVTATVTSGASQASYSITEVKQLATAATRLNTGKISNESNKIDPLKSFASQSDALGNQITFLKGSIVSNTINVKEDKQVIVLDGGTLKEGELPNIKVNGQQLKIVSSGTPKEGEVAIDASGQLTFGTPLAKDSVVKLDYIVTSDTEKYASFEINTHTSKGEVSERFFITENDSLNSVIRKVNESTVGVTMFYDSFSDKMTLTRKETGDFNAGPGNEIIVKGQFIEEVLRFGEGSNETGGQNAVFTINGLETERNANTFDMSGVTFTLKQKFLAVEGEAVAITIGNDSNQVLENIKGFVNQYNELIAEIGKKLNEEKHRSYKPLTDEEREGLSEKQQEKWEEMARSGLLKGDPILSSVLSAMRMDMSSSVETNGLFKQLASIGIKTTANYLEGGKLEIDETKLKAALEQDPDSVENLFRGSGVGADRGIIHKLYDTVDASMNKLRDKAGRATSTNQQFALGRELLSVDKGIDRFEDKMKIVENRYWRQFTAMEKAIQRANEQSMYLMQQFNNF